MPATDPGETAQSPRPRRSAARRRQPRAASVPTDAIRDILLEHIRDAVFATDLQNRVTFWGHSAELMFGYSAAEAIGRAFGELMPFQMADDADAEQLVATISAGRSWRGQGSVRLRDGSEIWVESTVNPILMEGQVIGSVSVSRDMTQPRRAERALRSVEQVGAILTEEGPTPSTLTAVLECLAHELGYRYLALLMRSGDDLRVDAQLGYDRLPDHFSQAAGIVGRAVRSRSLVFVPDVRTDPDYLAGDPNVTSEIAVPLTNDGELLGILNIESTDSAPLAEHDVRVAAAVADRIASALALGHERMALAERARSFAALSSFAADIDGILEEHRLWPAMVADVRGVVPAEVVMLTAIDRHTDRYLVRAVIGMPEEAIGREIVAGEGVTGRAIASGSAEFQEGQPRSSFPAAVRSLDPHDAEDVAAIPLVRESQVLGVITLGRAAGTGGYSSLEREVMGLIGSHAALALANAHLLDEVSALAVHDGLTGLFNRRHFDAAAERMVARWRREHAGGYTLSAIMFDLDRFGALNNAYGHQAGDGVLRTFAGILHERFRSNDLVARYGGEEFVVLLDGASLEDAVRAAERVRAELHDREIGPSTAPNASSATGDEPLRVTVSAGCAQLGETDTTLEGLLRTADVALSMAKRAGRNQVQAM